MNEKFRVDIGEAKIFSPEEISDEMYHADPCEKPSLSSGIAVKLLLTSPLHAAMHHPKLSGTLDLGWEVDRKSERRMDMGAIIHDLLLRGKKTFHLIEAENYRTKIAREERDYAIEQGKTPILVSDWKNVERINSAYSDTFIRDDFQNEHTIIWNEDGVLLRAKPDIFINTEKHLGIVDLKTTGLVPTTEGWGRRQIFEYMVQAALYRRGAYKLTGRMCGWSFAVIETSPPYDMAYFQFDAAAIAIGNKLVEIAIGKWEQLLEDCMKGINPQGYSKDVQTAVTPQWIVNSMEEYIEQESSDD